ncbi:MAG: lipid A deacylase LpxR family protein [Opitutales bacterium]
MKTNSLKVYGLALFWIGRLAAADSGFGGWQWITQWDNDLLTGTDEGYTNGARIALARELPGDSREHYFLERTLRRLSGAEGGGGLRQLRFPEAAASRFQYGMGLTQLMFTPDDPSDLTPPEGARPYAGWLGLEFSLQASAEDTANTVTLSIGTTGELSFAEEAQEWVHREISDSPIFQGWDSQAPGELTLNLHLDHKRRLSFLDGGSMGAIEADGFLEWGGALGNFGTNAYVGSHIRVGLNLPDRHVTPRVQLGSFTETIFGEPRVEPGDLSFYTFGGVRGYGVLHDISLKGPLFRNWAESVDLEPWVGELSFGVAARWKWTEVSLSHTLRSDEFEDQRNRSRYGSVLLRIGADF